MHVGLKTPPDCLWILSWHCNNSRCPQKSSTKRSKVLVVFQAVICIGTIILLNCTYSSSKWHLIKTHWAQAICLFTLFLFTLFPIPVTLRPIYTNWINLMTVILTHLWKFMQDRSKKKHVRKQGTFCKKSKLHLWNERCVYFWSFTSPVDHKITSLGVCATFCYRIHETENHPSQFQQDVRILVSKLSVPSFFSLS